MRKSIIILFCLFLVTGFVGCGGNSIKKSCKTLTKAEERLPEVYKLIEKIKENNPDFDDEDFILMLDEIKSALGFVTDATCKLNKVLEENER